ncbi:MAG TPA: hypothetical protein ENL20_00470 [Candidatus Cloacimonetes bacterium]|nr:hypothetical protein [Candidatus Cloacimonadota bacterium]
MKKQIFIIILLIGILSLQAITVNQLKQMQNSGELIVGKGEAKTESEADKYALQDLASQIIVEVKSSFVSIAREENFKIDEYCESVVKTFTDIQLSNAKKFIDPASTKNNQIIYRYLTPEDKERIFAERKTQILSLVAEGEIAESSNNAVDAIRNYYWALMLLKTHPEHKTITYYFDHEERLLNTALVNQIEKILSKIKIEITSIKDVKDSNCLDILLFASYQGMPADGLLVKYNDGYQWSDFERWTNGKGYFSIKKVMAKTLSFIEMEIDCSFREHGFSGEIRETLGSMKAKKFNNSYKKCELQKEEVKNIESVESVISYEDEISREKIAVLNNIITAISKKDLGTSRKYFTARGFRDFNALIGYGNAEILPEKITLKMLKIGDLRVVRSIPLKFDFRSSNEDFTENVNFVFDQDNKIDGVTFSLSDLAIKDIMSKKYGTDEEKALIVNFIEQYKTAYCLKDIDFIEDVFCDDALIIVGRVIQRKPDDYSDRLYQQLGAGMIEYITLKKGEYIKRLQKQFSKKEFINIRFSDNTIDRVSSKGKKVFGMQIGQYYYSSDYRDKGYLFLMFDLENPDEPKIMVRSWQPEKAADGSIIGVSDFQFD